MKYYEELLDKKCFSFKEVERLVGGNRNTAKSLLRQYVQKGYIQQIKKNLYVAVSMESGMPVATRYQIASSITPTSYVSHHSAFSYYGYTNQVSYEMNVSSDTAFGDFEYAGITYKYISSRLPDGIMNQQGVRVTDLERTTMDYIRDFDRIGGLEELMRSLEMIPFLSEEKLLQYLELADRAVLYQKAGYILEHFRNSLKLSDDFFRVCSLRKGKSRRYFTKETDQNHMVYNSRWGLMVPEHLLDISEY
ncbi:MAG: transcriptional regulator [Bacillus sp. (in: Bacteria)]|nr:transcriptional regulator [Bacillus sp. (in: firmicutes)]MCM1427733.1 transcriptional regulator [Eubacterium sp.]